MRTRKKAQLDQALLAAVVAGDLERVQSLIAAGADPRCTDDEPLCLAAMNGHLALVTYLVKSRGADPSAQGGRPLAVAVSGGFLPLVKYLVEDRGVSLMGGDGTNPRDHVLYLAATGDHVPVVRYLIEERGVDPRLFEDECLCWAAMCGCLEVVKYFLEEQGIDPYVQDNWLLRNCAELGYADLVRYLVEERGVDPRTNGGEAVVAAVEGGSELVAYLAERMFSVELWRGRNRTDIEAEANRLAGAIEAGPSRQEPERTAEAVEIVARQALQTILALQAEADRAKPLRIAPPPPPQPL